MIRNTLQRKKTQTERTLMHLTRFAKLTFIRSVERRLIEIRRGYVRNMTDNLIFITAEISKKTFFSIDLNIYLFILLFNNQFNYSIIN